MSIKIDCTVIGDAMIDIVIPLLPGQTSQELFQRGLLNVNSKVSFGGTANVAVALSGVGGKSAFIGKIGDDCFGRAFVEDLDSSGVLNKIAVSKDKSTGIVMDFVLPGGDRAFLIDRGANSELAPEDIDFDLVRDSTFIYFTGFSFQDKQTSETIRKTMEETSRCGATIIFNPGAATLASEFREEFIRIIKSYVNILILNFSEAQNLAGLKEEDEILAFLLTCVDTVALTKGSRGSTIAGKGKIHRLGTYQPQVVDTTGAGDAYAAGFIYGLARGWKEEDAGDFAAKIAARAVSHLGAREWLKPGTC